MEDYIMTKISVIKRYAFHLTATVLLLGLAQSCKEDIDMSDRYTFTDYTIASYLEEHSDTYSEYIRLLSEVNISSRSTSSVFQLMSARGKYTMFAPTNEAIQNYLDTLCAKGIIPEPSWDAFPNDTICDSIKNVIVFNSILDGTKDDIEPIQSSSFPQDGEEFSIANMNDRKLSISYNKLLDSMFINGVKDKATGNVIKGCLIDPKNHDIYTINGYIHQVKTVIAPSNETLADLFISYVSENAGDYIVTAKMIIAAGLADTLSKVKDEIYEELKQSDDVRLTKLTNFNANGGGDLPEHRYYGYTIFAEPDDFWRAELGKEPSDISAADIQAWVVAKGYYPDAQDNTDYKSEDNVLNQFITYHILPMRLPVEKLVIHYNERGYSWKTSTQYTIPTYELYTTMGKRRLMKLYQCGPRYSLNGDSKIYLNRFPVLDNGRHGTYAEVSVTPETEGIEVQTDGAISLINSYIYPIDKPLVYDEKTRENFQRQRLRFDLTSIFPEFMNNDLRANRNVGLWTGMPADSKYKYLDDVDLLDGTEFYYLNGLEYTWNNWQGDELNIRGRYEMIFRLPPVPKAGTYEIRYAIQANSEKRSMCQVYFGSDKNNLPAMGIPLDLRMGGQYRHLPSSAGGNLPSIVGWILDTEDDDYNAEVDKRMRNNGYMKGPANYAFTPGGSNYARNNETTIRRILVREYMYPDKTYYLKFKSVLDDTMKECYMDYLEICAKEVYDNPMTPEDIW